jgi:3-oxoacyl-[acyl-carrier protein] reductase
MLMAREAAKHFITRNQGNIVNICSTASLRGAPRGTTYYGASRHDVLREQVRASRDDRMLAELRPHNVRVFLAREGRTETDQTEVAVMFRALLVREHWRVKEHDQFQSA